MKGCREFVLAAACALLASCASAPVAAPAPAPDYRPAPRSTLLSSRDVDFVVAFDRRRDGTTTLLACRASGTAAAQPVARVEQVRRGEVEHVSIERIPHAASCAADGVAVLEQLYALLLRHEPQARYCLSLDSVEAPCLAGRDEVSHARVLQSLGEARTRLAARAPTAVPWRHVQMREAPMPFWDADVVGVRAMAHDAPLEGVPIYFNRAPHSLCMARTRADGVAMCRLEDQHGDGHQHDHATSVVATFPGDVRADRVLLPTTHVLPAPAALRMPNVQRATPGPR